jgi:hypothetical protein
MLKRKSPAITGSGLLTMRGNGSSFVQTAISFWLWIGEVSRIPFASQPNPKVLNVSNIIRFMARPPESPASIVFFIKAPASFRL